MSVKLPIGDLNSDSYPSYPTSIYTCKVTTALKVHGGRASFFYKYIIVNCRINQLIIA